jgi:hypothetical protein
MSKQHKIKRRKRKTGYPKITKGSGFKYEFSSFAEFAKHMVPKGTAVA